jgi:hypothetical protein
MLPARLPCADRAAQGFAIQGDDQALASVGLAHEEISHHLLEFFNVNDATQDIPIGVRTRGAGLFQVKDLREGSFRYRTHWEIP